MTTAVVFGLCGAAAAGLGLYGVIANPQPLRKILAFNLLSSGVFLFFGVVARRGAVSAFSGDPVPQALVITGIVVAAAGTALAVALLLQFFKATGSTTLNANALASHRRRFHRRMMPGSAQVPDVATAGGFLLVLSIFVPVAAVLLAFVSGGRNVERIAFATMPAGLAIAVAIAAAKRSTGAPIVYLVGGWAPPLGVALRADGLSAVMMVIAAVVICAVAIYARADFRTPPELAEARAPFAFWILLLSIWSALNLVFVAGDLFTLYVGLELLTFAAVPLVCLDGRAETFQAALRYLLFALLGSVLYLAGTVLIYGAYGTLDIVLLSQRIRPEPVTIIAAALMTAGLLAKTALFPLASVASASPRLGTCRGQCGIVGARREGAIFHRGAPLVRCDAELPRSNRKAVARGAWRRCDCLRQYPCAAPDETEAFDRLLDAGADRLSLSDVSARHWNGVA